MRWRDANTVSTTGSLHTARRDGARLLIHAHDAHEGAGPERPVDARRQLLGRCHHVTAMASVDGRRQDGPRGTALDVDVRATASPDHQHVRRSEPGIGTAARPLPGSAGVWRSARQRRSNLVPPPVGDVTMLGEMPQTLAAQGVADAAGATTRRVHDADVVEGTVHVDGRQSPQRSATSVPRTATARHVMARLRSTVSHCRRSGRRSTNPLHRGDAAELRVMGNLHQLFMGSGA